MAGHYMKTLTKRTELRGIFLSLSKELRLPTLRTPLETFHPKNTGGAYLQGDTYRIQHELNPEFETLVYRDRVVTATFTRKDTPLASYTIHHPYFNDQRKHLETCQLKIAQEILRQLPRTLDERLNAYHVDIPLTHFDDVQDFLLKHITS